MNVLQKIEYVHFLIALSFIMYLPMLWIRIDFNLCPVFELNLELFITNFFKSNFDVKATSWAKIWSVPVVPVIFLSFPFR
jgi:hypothetical protein